ncbi:hypothetical protein H0E87_008696, partial [Populus deltoides]
VKEDIDLGFQRCAILHPWRMVERAVVLATVMSAENQLVLDLENGLFQQLKTTSAAQPAETTWLQIQRFSIKKRSLEKQYDQVVAGHFPPPHKAKNAAFSATK